ncbi:unnamed protein product [Calicophoron daubneyi]|uniref:FHA domain-containing protein n=1 Tax=Calicophoron daubneyi TaxID=300641 RepID=A0AAV2TFT2_CALDB
MKLNELPMTPANKNLTAKEREELKQQVREEMMEKMRANIAELEAQNQQKFQEKLEQARREAAQMALEAQAKDETSVGPTKVKPYLSNLNEDPQLSGVIQHLLVHKNTGLGRRQAGADDCVIGDKTQKVYWVHMQGLGIATEHAILIRHGKTGSKVELRVLEGVNKLTKVNGTPVRESVFLQHNDRILFGSHQLYLFKNPLAEKRDDGTETSDDLDWEYAQRELAEKTGFEAFEKKPKSKEDIILQKQLLELIPILAEANGIAEELGKNRTFDLLLVPPTAQGLVYGEKKETRIVIRMRDTTTNNIWLWDKDQFMEHRFTMQEMYQNFLGNSKTTIPKEEDPFLQPLSPRLVGVAPAFLQALGYRLDVDDKLRLTSIEGEEAGSLDFQIIPCTKTGKVLVDTDDSGEPDFVEDPHELLGRPFSFKVIINGITLFNSRDRNAVSVDYRIFRETKFTSIKFPKAYFKGPLSGRIPSDNERIFSIGPVTPEVLDYFANECICFMVYTSQDDRSYQDTNVQRKDKEICRTMSFVRDEEVSDINKLKTILSLTQKKLKRHSKRDEKIKRFIEQYRQSPPTPENYKNVLESLANVFASQKSSPHTLNRSSASSNPPLNRTSRANDSDDN